MAIVIILSGGLGSRFGSRIPKQYLKIKDSPILLQTLEIFQNNKNIDKIVIVASNEWRVPITEWMEKKAIYKFVSFVKPGETRQKSIINALNEILNMGIDNDLVVIHDAVRPFVSQELIDRCIEACGEDVDGVMPVLPVTDTTYLCDNGTITGLLDRQRLFSGQSPEAFWLKKYYSANINTPEETLIKINGSSEIAFLAGLKIRIIDGEATNIKITTKEDLDRINRS